MDENVAKAVGEVDLRFTSGNAVPVERASVRDHEWQTIRARLVELEAENERLLADCDLRFKQAMQNGQSAQVQRARAEKADALLRECDEVARKRGDKYGLCDAMDNTGQPYQSQFLADHLAHLSENGHG